MSLPPDVEKITQAFLAAIDTRAPGLVSGLYLHGSLGFGEYVPGRSDIDFVAVLTCRPDDQVLPALRSAHAEVAAQFARPYLDGIHLVQVDLAAGPSECPDVPCVRSHAFAAASRFELNPVTWHGLAEHGITLRGPDHRDLQIWTDAAVLREFTRANLDTYWRSTLAYLHANPTEAADPEATEWCAIGVSRLHHLLVTGAMTSKSGAGRYALEAFGPQWRPIVAEALRVREGWAAGSEYDGAPDRRRTDLLGFMQMVIDDGTGPAR